MAQTQAEPAPEKPTLHDIAAMPYPRSVEAMREHYNKDWGRPVPEGADELRTFKVRISYSVRTEESEVYEVEAYSEDEAEEIATDRFDKERCDADEAEIDDIEVDEVSG